MNYLFYLKFHMFDFYKCGKIPYSTGKLIIRKNPIQENDFSQPSNTPCDREAHNHEKNHPQTYASLSPARHDPRKKRDSPATHVCFFTVIELASLPDWSINSRRVAIGQRARRGRGLSRRQ